MGHDDARFEAGEQSLPVPRGEPAPGDPGEQIVDASVADLVVDEVARALVVEANAGDGDVDAPDLPAFVGARRQVIGVLAGQLPVGRRPEACGETRVTTRDERDLERADLVATVGLDGYGEGGAAGDLHQLAERCAAVRRTTRAGGERRDVERVIEVGMPDEDRRRVGQRGQAVRVGRDGPAAQQLPERDPRPVRIDQQVPALVAEAKAGRAEPLEFEARREIARARRTRPGEVAVRRSVGVRLRAAARDIGEQRRDVAERSEHAREDRRAGRPVRASPIRPRVAVPSDPRSCRGRSAASRPPRARACSPRSA